MKGRIALVGVLLFSGIVAEQSQDISFVHKNGDLEQERKLIIDTFVRTQGYGAESLDYMTKTVDKEIEHIKESVNALALSAYKQDKCVGVAFVYISAGEGSLYIPRLAVDPSVQGQGIGKALIRMVYNIFLPSRMVVIARKNNVSGIAFYKKLGFHVTDWLDGRDPEKYCSLWWYKDNVSREKLLKTIKFKYVDDISSKLHFPKDL